MDMEKCGAFIRARRTEQGLSQQALATLAANALLFLGRKK